MQLKEFSIAVSLVQSVMSVICEKTSLSGPILSKTLTAHGYQICKKSSLADKRKSAMVIAHKTKQMSQLHTQLEIFVGFTSMYR